MRYLIGRIKARILSAFVGYLDFKSAFDNPDVAVMIRWLELTGLKKKKNVYCPEGGDQSRPWGAHLIQQRLRGPVITGYHWGLPRLARP